MIATLEQIEEMKKNSKVQLTTKFTIDSDVLKGIKNIYKGYKVSKIPVFNYMLLEVVNKNVIKIKYTNNDLYVEKMFFATVENIGRKSFLIPIAFFKDIKYIKKNEIFTFEEINESIFTFTRDNLTHTLSVLDETEYPNFDFLEEESFEQIETSNGYEYFELNDLKVIEKAIISTSKSETRPVLQEVFIKDGKVVSTDSHRLYTANTVFKSEKGFLLNPVLIQKASEVLDKNMFIKLSVSSNRIKIQDDYSTKIYFNHHEGNFPDTSRIIPNEFKYKLEVDKVNDLHNFLKSTKNTDIVHLKLDVNKAIINLKVESDNATSTIDIPVKVNEFDERNFKMAMSSRYFKEGIEQLDKESLTMNILSHLRPMVLNKQKSNKETVLILPVRTY